MMCHAQQLEIKDGAQNAEMSAVEIVQLHSEEEIKLYIRQPIPPENNWVNNEFI